MKFAVAFVDEFNGEVTIELIESDSAKGAIRLHSRLIHTFGQSWVNGLPDNIEDIREVWHTVVDVVEIEG